MKRELKIGRLIIVRRRAYEIKEDLFGVSLKKFFFV
jgi:hypothetical protein